ncbi:MAG: hypothetical protein KAT62_00615 [Desulfuromonadales bacterium]|nr:hypothetical protein [Desulfuromonadales bacterium]
MKYMNCPVCREKTVPIGGSECEFCGWKKGVDKVEDQGLTTNTVVDQKTENIDDKEPIEQPKKRPKYTMADCADCGENKRIVSRGLCSKCRYKHIKNDTLDKLHPASGKRGRKPSNQAEKHGGAEEKTKTPAAADTPLTATKEKVDNRIARITVNFYPEDKEILRELKSAAKHNRRDLTQEILFRMEHGRVV